MSFSFYEGLNPKYKEELKKNFVKIDEICEKVKKDLLTKKPS
jgi:hypothetical protein